MRMLRAGPRGPAPADTPGAPARCRRAWDRFRLANDRAYLLPRRGRLVARTPALGPVDQPVSAAFCAALAAFRRLAAGRKELAGAPLLLDAAHALRPRAPNTSRVVRTVESGPAAVVFLQRARLPFDEYVVAHELVHLTLYLEGLPKLERSAEAAPAEEGIEGRALSAVSTATSHFLVHPRMRAFGFDVGAREAARFRAFQAAVQRRRPQPLPDALTLAEFFWQLPRRAGVAAFATTCDAETQRLFTVAVHLLQQADLSGAPSAASVQQARRRLLEAFGLGEGVRFVDPFSAAT